MSQVHALILSGLGINCEEEMAAAYRLGGAEAEIRHLGEIFRGTCSLHEFDVVNFPGGFSFGDDLGAGKALANRLKYKKLPSGKRFINELERFLGEGKFIFGVCNGFQVLVKMGLVPNLRGAMEQEVTLTHNDSGRFEDRWCSCAVNAATRTPFLRGIDRIDLPVRHGEGKLVIRDEEIRRGIIEESLNCLSYCDAQGAPTAEYPLNPNGSALNCAGLTDRSGQILGMMPHPEAFLSRYNHPNWARLVSEHPGNGDGDGLGLFKAMVGSLLAKKEGIFQDRPGSALHLRNPPCND